jgi:hypothetical protein
MVASVILFLVVPAVSGKSIPDMLSGWFNDYNEAIEEAEQADDDDDADSQDANVAEMEVVLDDDIEAYSGIETQSLNLSTFKPESKAVAKVVDLLPLISLRTHYVELNADLSVAITNEQAAQDEVRRLNALSKATKSVASKNLTYAETNWQQANAESKAIQSKLRVLKDQIQYEWGSALASWLIEGSSDNWKRLITHQDSLVLVTIPTTHSLPEHVKTIRLIHPISKSVMSAEYVGEARMTDERLQGETYFFHVKEASLRLGLRLDVWFEAQADALEGIFIPEQAIVWSSGQPWVYVEVEEGRYQRRSVQAGLKADKGIFLDEVDDFEDGEELVVSGAQMLLSEEFRWQILDEDDD